MSVSLIQLKQDVSKFPASFTSRSLILSEPDEMNESEVKTKALMWDKVLRLDLEKSR